MPRDSSPCEHCSRISTCIFFPFDRNRLASFAATSSSFDTPSVLALRPGYGLTPSPKAQTLPTCLDMQRSYDLDSTDLGTTNSYCRAPRASLVSCVTSRHLDSNDGDQNKSIKVGTTTECRTRVDIRNARLSLSDHWCCRRRSEVSGFAARAFDSLGADADEQPEVVLVRRIENHVQETSPVRCGSRPT